MLLDYHENGLVTGQLSLDGGSWLKRMAARPRVISIMPAFTDERRKVEDFIIEVYNRSYGAKIGVHYPILMSVRDDQNNILAALGFRYADHAPLPAQASDHGRFPAACAECRRRRRARDGRSHLHDRRGGG